MSNLENLVFEEDPVKPMPAPQAWALFLGIPMLMGVLLALLALPLILLIIPHLDTIFSMLPAIWDRAQEHLGLL